MIEPGTPAWRELEEWAPLIGSPIFTRLLKEGRPISREIYLRESWGTELPSPWTGEHEGEVPIPLQDWSKVDWNPGSEEMLAFWEQLRIEEEEQKS